MGERRCLLKSGVGVGKAGLVVVGAELVVRKVVLVIITVATFVRVTSGDFPKTTGDPFCQVVQTEGDDSRVDEVGLVVDLVVESRPIFSASHLVVVVKIAIIVETGSRSGGSA